MINKLLDNKRIIEENAEKLWRGNGADIGVVSKTIHNTSNMILEIIEDASDEDKATTIQYLKGGLEEFENAHKNRDDFLLADCLYYIWRELIAIYVEVLEGE